MNQLAQVVNWYVYTANNPLKFIDPDGRQSQYALEQSLWRQITQKFEQFYYGLTHRGEHWDSPVTDAMRITPVAGTAIDVVEFGSGRRLNGNEISAGEYAVEIPFVFLSMTPAGGAAKGATRKFSQATLKSFQKQLQKHGKKSLLKSKRRIQQHLTTHQQKLKEIRKAGGHASSVERELRTFRSQLDAIDDVLKGGGD